jgi:ligand-binding SRPBCC domain-containing protein
MGIRVVNLRTGVVLATQGGALSKMGPVVLGSGRQWMSWIHLDDMIAFIRHALENQSVAGPHNLVAPQPIRQKDFVHSLMKARRISISIPVPATVLKLALGEMSEIILGSQRVLPKRTLAAGFQFRFPDIDSALANLFKRGSSLDQTFSAEQFVEAPRDKVVPFFSRAENLEVLTPPWLNFRILKKSSSEISPGSIIDYRLNIHGVPVKWKTLISEWNLPLSFTDEQLKGPYRKWHHVHSFYEVSGGTLLTDQVTYRVPFSWVGKLVLSSWIARDVKTIFNFRKKKIRELTENRKFS